MDARSLSGPGPNVSTQVESLIRRRILTGEISPGTWLRESTLAVEHGISRTPVREACSRIAGDGLLLWTQRRGYRAPEMERKEIQTAYPVIIALEILAIESLSEPIDTLVAELRQSNYGIDEVSEDIYDRYNSDRLWHMRFVMASQNEVLIDLHDRLLERISRYLYAYWQHRSDISQSLKEHAQLVSAIERQDTQLAVALLRSHRKMGLARIERILDQVLS